MKILNVQINHKCPYYKIEPKEIHDKWPHDTLAKCTQTPTSSEQLDDILGRTMVMPDKQQYGTSAGNITKPINIKKTPEELGILKIADDLQGQLFDHKIATQYIPKYVDDFTENPLAKSMFENFKLLISKLLPDATPEEVEKVSKQLFKSFCCFQSSGDNMVEALKNALKNVKLK